MSFLKGFFAIFAHIFSNFFHEAKLAFKKLTPEEQAALTQGSGVVNIINTAVGKTPDEIRAEITAAFPNIDEAALESSLIKVLATFGVIPGDTSLNGLIASVQAHLSAQTGHAWEIATHTASSALAIFFGPPEMKFAAVTNLIEYVYQDLIKKH